MTKEAKIMLAVFGSLVGLVALAIAGAIAFVTVAISHHVTNRPGDAAVVAAKIARVRLPAGYRYGASVDLSFFNVAAIEAPAERGPFVILLEGLSLPIGSDDEAFEKSVQQGLGSGARCSDTIRARERLRTASGRVVSLKTVACESGTQGTRLAEYGRIPSAYPFALVVAFGSPATFDHAAFREVVRSIR